WFACLKPGKFEACCGLDPSTVFTEEMRGRADLGIVARMANRLQANPPSLLHAHTPRSAMVAGLLAKRLDIPWVYHVHSPTARDSTRAWINRVNDWVEGWALRSASHIITVSNSLRREMLRRGYSRHRLTKVANGVATQESIATLDRMEQREWRLGMVALVRPRKGIEVLLEAMKQIQLIRPQVTLDVIGGFETEEYQREVLALSDRLNLRSHVRWLGFSTDVPSRIRELDALVLPSLFGEGMPMVVLEAMALGVPVVATTVEGTPEVVRHGIEGYLAEPRDATSLANTILKMVDDRLIWHRLSANAWERQRALFSDRAMAETVAKVYRRTLNVL
ncbi:MAG: glycosyltransferase family 4 protein, partial [Planctomycetes bacterium]|nr:glycosyltransferase family 4 protein [Planctomycetota bacterium]